MRTVRSIRLSSKCRLLPVFNHAIQPDERLDKLEVLLGADQDTLKLVAPMMGLDGNRAYGALDLTPPSNVRARCRR